MNKADKKPKKGAKTTVKKRIKPPKEEPLKVDTDFEELVKKMFKQKKKNKGTNTQAD